jgi:hypothetical protein
VQTKLVVFASNVQTAPAGDEVIVYPVIADPPLFTGATNEIVADPEVVLVAVTEVGGSGTVAGITLTEDVEATEVNSPLLAVTANVYAVPFVKPVHEKVAALTLAVHVPPAGDGVTV